MTTFDVAIVGLGPTGATLANLCGLHALRTVVFEQSPAPYSQPRACHLDAEVARVFQQCGFEAELHDLLTVSAGMEYVDAHGRRLFTFEGFEREPLLGWHEDYVFVQPALEQMLRAGLARFPHVEVRLGSPAPSLVELLDTAAFVVACDGAGSSIRDALGIGLLDLRYDERWLVVDVVLHDQLDPPLPAIIQQVCSAERLATFVPSHGGHRRWEFLLHGDEQPDAWLLLAPWGVTPAHGELVRAVPYRFHALVADCWRGGPDGQVFLAGDAAHQMPPFMGQGMCSGVRDAANLAWKLAEVTRSESPAELLDTYEAERRPHTETVVAMSIEAGRTLSRLAADPTDLPTPDTPDPRRWSRLPALALGGPFPVGHLLPQPDHLDDRLPPGWVWVAADVSFPSPDGRPVVVEPPATYGERAVLVRPDRYIAATAGWGNADCVTSVGQRMELATALAFVRQRSMGVLVTLKRDGRPQMSNITYSVGDDGVIRISITADRAKYNNLVRDPRASLHVNKEDFWGYVVIDADVTLSEVAADPNDAAVEELIDLYKAVSGEHPDWDDYRAAMVNDRRVVVRLTPTHAYGMGA